ncbi:MAG: amino acid adenylation domain-containing protein [Nocardioides sp.]|nr:amino acid adenylation domain-containing protein [Nocardioides sp.]
MTNDSIHRSDASTDVLCADDIRQAVAAWLQVPVHEISDQDDLVALGLDSLGVMTLAASWQEAGAAITFGELIEEPTVESWTALMGVSDGAGAVTEPVEDGELEEFALAPMQHAYWSGRQPGMPLGTGSHFYFEFDTTADDVDRWDRAVSFLRKRHPMLRACVGATGHQRISPDCRGLDDVVDLRRADDGELHEQLAALREELSHQALDLAQGRGLDVRLVLLPDARVRLLLDLDMIVCDAVSFRIVISDLARLYTDRSDDLPAPSLTFREYRRLVDESDRGPRPVDVAYWRDRAEALPTAPQLPLAVPPEQLAQVRTVRRHCWLPPEPYHRLVQHARGHGLTVSMAMASVYADVMAAWSDGPRFLLNLPVLNRLPVDPDVRRVVGDFTELLLLEVSPDSRRSFVDRARAVQEQYRRDAAHSAYGGTSVLRDLARTTAGASQRAGVVFTSALSLGGLFDSETTALLGDPVWMSSQTAGVWIDLQLIEHKGGMLINWETCENLFAEGVPEAMFEAFVNRVRLLASQPSAWGEQLPVRLPQQQEVARIRANATHAPLPRRGLHEEFFRMAGERGDAVAASWGDGETLSHAALAGRALRLAEALRRAGTTRGDRVVITLPQGIDQVVAVLAVHSLGATYVPVGVNQPDARRRAMQARAGARVAVRRESGPGRDEDQVTVVDVRQGDDPAATPLAALAEVDPDDPAYVIFTSGSTGEPKGVELTHAAALNTVTALNQRFGVGRDDRTLCLSALDFDLSVYDIFGPLNAGGAVVLVSNEDRRSPETWLEAARVNGATILNCVPALLDMALTTVEDRLEGFVWPFRLQLLGGDWVGLDLPDRVHAQSPESVFVALGGTTETAIHSTVQVVEQVPPSWASIPYNVPLPNQRCRVADEHGHHCPDWVVGELWIGGAGVARGYIGDPELTAAKFVDRDGERWYRTGDLARYTPGGIIEFLGRADFQVKLNGYRVELGEVEQALCAHPGVREAVVTTVPESAALCALLTPADVDPEAALRAAAERLPDYMVPARAATAAELPLSRNGKIDRSQVRELLAESLSGAPSRGGAPQGPAEQAVARVWADLLGARDVGRDDNFFHLGGDSLLATRMLTALGRAGYSARLGDLFTAPVLAAFADRAEPAAATAEPAALAADLTHRHDPFPLTDVQRAYWLGRDPQFTLGGVGSYWYWEFESDHVDLDRLQKAWRILVRRHEMMRAVLDGNGGQRILAEVPDYEFDVTRTTSHDHDQAVAQLQQMEQQVLDVTTWPLFDVRAVQRDDEHTVIGMGFDYVVLDALSIMTIFAELSQLYDEPCGDLPELTLSFRDYLLGTAVDPAARQRDEAYWLETIEELPPAPVLPMARPPEQIEQPRFVRREFRLDRDTWDGLRRRTAAEGLTVSTVLATAFAEVLAAWSAESSLTLNLTVFDRRDVHPQVNDVVGDFTSLLLLGHHSRPEDSWADAVRRLQGQVWAGIEHNSVSATWVLQQLARRAGAAQMLMPVVFTSTLGVSADFADLAFSFGERTRGLSQSPQVALDCQVVELDGGLSVNWDYVDGLFCPGVPEAALEALRRLLVELADRDWSRRTPGVVLPDDQTEVRRRVNDTAVEMTPRTLHLPIFAVAEERPDTVAVRASTGEALSYRALVEGAMAVAGCLSASGVREGDPVVVSLAKGPDQVVAVLGVLAAGGCYVPVGVEQPPARRNRIVRSSGTRFALVDDVFTGAAEPADDWPEGTVLCPMASALEADPLPEPTAVHPEQLAYVIYTSGSTGEPKGVEISHAAAANTIDDVSSRYDVGPSDVALQVSALDFDLSVYDLFGLLAVGGTVVTITEDTRREAATWARCVAEHGVTIWNTVPTLLDMVLVAGESGTDLSSLRLAMVSGDWVGLDLCDRLHAAAPGARMVAMGGATEASIWSNAFDVEAVDPAWVSVPYGYPLANQQFRVVDEHGRDRPDWVPGELWIGGAGVARGYRGDSERTAASFVHADGRRWYRTGDQGRYLPSGVLEFLGRSDHQVKVRGHRVELGEIETRLRELPGVGASVVWVDGTAAGRHLVAAVTGTDTGALHGDALRRALADALPAYMVPDHIAVLDQLPLNANGKVDRRALARDHGLDLTGGEADDPLQSATERAVAEIWQTLLQVPAVRRSSNFFALGGDSLNATRVLQQLARRFGVELSLRQLFNHATLADLAGVLDAEIAGGDQHDETILEEGVL